MSGSTTRNVRQDSSDAADERSGPPTSVTRLLETSGLADESTAFEPLRGGRSNQLWKFASNGRVLVCKLYTNRTTPLFPNDSRAEKRTLQLVSGKRLGPLPVISANTRDRTALIYEFIEGPHWQNDAGAVGALLARLHAVPPPRDLRKVPAGGQEILALGQRMLSDCSGPDAQHLFDLRPEPPAVPETKPVLLHGDVVPENLIDSPKGLRLIDWQCAAQGDPAEDLAVFLSPAMQTLYGNAPLSKSDKTSFFDGLDNQALAERYLALAPALHWRMATYCLWQSVQGDSDYLAGFRLEVDLLESLT